LANGQKPMKPLRIRDARPGDREGILEVTLSAFREYADLMGSSWEGYKQNILATLAEAELTEQIVAEKRGAIVGAVVLLPAGTVVARRESSPSPLASPEVRLLAVVPHARGQGIGKALVSACIRRATRSGDSFLTLHTSDMMRVAQRLYKRMGFVHTPDLDFHFDDSTVKGYRLKLKPDAQSAFGSEGE
jgi:GNAT superfamily N-acetyltransferase